MKDTLIKFTATFGKGNTIIETHPYGYKNEEKGVVWTENGCFVRLDPTEGADNFIEQRVKNDAKNYSTKRGENSSNSTKKKQIGAGYEGEDGTSQFFNRVLEIPCTLPDKTIKKKKENDADLILDKKIALNVKAQPNYNEYPYGVSHMFLESNLSPPSKKIYKERYKKYQSFWVFTGVWKRDYSDETWVKIYGFLPYDKLSDFINESYLGNPAKVCTYMDIPEECKKLKHIAKHKQIYDKFPPYTLFNNNLNLITELVRDFYI